MDPDDLDELLDGDRPDLETRFRELEQEAEMERLRRQAGVSPDAEGERGPGRSTPADSLDPLAELKAEVEGRGQRERFLLVVCPSCQAQNRMSLRRVRTMEPVCGRCKSKLSFTREA